MGGGNQRINTARMQTRKLSTPQLTEQAAQKTFLLIDSLFFDSFILNLIDSFVLIHSPS